MDVNFSIRFSNDNRVHITNTTNKPIYVIAVPNGDWLIGDFAFSVATTLLFPPAGVTKIKSVYDLFKALKLLMSFASLSKQLYTAMSSSEKEKLDRELSKVKKMFEENGKNILPGESVLVNEKLLFSSLKGVMKYSLLIGEQTHGIKELRERALKELDTNEDISFSDFLKQADGALNFLNPSTFASVFSFVSDLRLIVADSDLQRICSFATNSDHSWIVKNDEIVRAKYGKLEQEAPDEGRVIFSKPLGISLEPGMYLEPGQSLENDYYVFVYQLGGNLVLYEKNLAGNIVSRVLWASDTHGKKAWKACMQEDGNFVVYSEPGQVGWAWKKEMPSGYKNSIIILDHQLGIIYFKNRNQMEQLVPYRQLEMNEKIARELYKIKSDIHKDVSRTISEAKDSVEETIDDLLKTEVGRNVTQEAYTAASKAEKTASEAKKIVEEAASDVKRTAKETASKIAEGFKKIFPW